MKRLAVVVVSFVLIPTASFADELAPPVDWSKHMGKLLFAIGYERGMKEVTFTGKAPMFFFSSSKDPWCPKYAARTFTDARFLECISDYTPVLIDADRKENKKLKEEYGAVLVPAVFWADFDGDAVFMAMGDAPLQLARQAAEVAKERAPERREPGKGAEKLIELRDAMRKAVKGKKVRPIVDSIAAVRKFGAGAAVQLEADRIDIELWKKGNKRIAQAEAHIKKRRKSSAKSVLKKIVKDYGEHPIGKRATKLLASLSS
ncbi:MAG: hypothetical protein ACYSX0_09740 [Planctomycetota bacterium]|jgi:hypothetical protein